jgi:rhodanese-related sulfurtransferase
MLGLTRGSFFLSAPWREIAWGACWVFLASSCLGLVVNTLRRDGIPLYQTQPHEILVPCPETLGNAEAFDPQDPRVHSDRALWVDARSEGDYAAWHPSHARSIPYDFLLPTDASVIKALAASGAAHVVVYGDGANPDSGEQLAMELSGRGIKNVGYLRGGASALRAALKVGQP